MTTKSYPSLRGLFRRLRSGRKQSSATRRWKRESLMLEPLESRMLMSGDSLGALDLQSNSVIGGGTAATAALYSSSVSPAASLQAEGEDQQTARDLIAFAKGLATAGAVEYGAAWCLHCTEQKELFATGEYYVPFVEVTNADRTLNATGTAKSITSFPTWDIPDPGHVRFNALQLTANAIPSGSYSFPDANTTRVVGAYSLDVLSQLSGVAIPLANSPYVATISDTGTEVTSATNLTVLAGSPLYLPLRGYDPNGDALTYTVTSTNAAVSTTVSQSNPSAEIDVKGWGHITAQLFQDKAARPVDQFSQLAESGFYDYTSSSATLTTRTGDRAAQFTTTATPVVSTSDTVDVSWTSSGTTVTRVGMTVTAVAGNVVTVSGGTDQLATGGTTVTNLLPGATTAVTLVRKTPFHRVIDGFMIQSGDPQKRNGTGGSTLGDFDDQFNLDLQYNREGVLGYANAGANTNDSQFFVTLAPFRTGDFTYSIFGQVTEGFNVLEAIGKTKVQTQSGGSEVSSPTTEIDINKVTIFQDTKNALVMLKAPVGTTGTSDITVTVSDGHGHTSQQTFHVTVQADTTNNHPFLGDVAASQLTVPTNTVAQIQLPGFDAENDALTYSTTKLGSVAYTISTNATTGVTTITPPANYVGPLQFSASVALSSAPATAVDTNTVTLAVVPSTPTLTLTSASDSGTVGDNLTNVNKPVFHVTNVLLDATVQILDGTTVVGQGTATGTSLDITVDLSTKTDGTYALTAVQTLSAVKSLASSAVQLQLDTTAPAAITSTAPTKAFVDSAVAYNVQSADEGKTGFVYSLVTGPTGAAIDAATGLLTWTPAAAQIGSQSFQVRLTDLAGNAVTQALSINVVQASVLLHLQATDLSGNPITHVSLGSQFLLQVLTQDLSGSSSGGVFAAYLDVAFDPTLVSPVGQALSNITFVNPYTNGKAATFASGAINEMGAFAGTSPLGDTEQLMLSIPMTAVKAGTVSFTGTPATAVGHEVLVYGQNSAVSTNLVNYAAGSLIVDSALTANADTFNVDEDSSANNLPVVTNDVNNQGGTLTITAVGAVDHGGTVTIASDNQHLLYTPAANFSGQEQFTYTLSNGQSTSTATVTVQVQPKNDAPTANSDSFTVATGSQSNAVNVLANDSFAPDLNETLRVLSVGTTDKGGTVTIAPNGTNLVYTPQAGFTGTETFTYTMTDRADSSGLTAQASVTVTVSALPIPTVVADTATVNESSSATVINVLSNDTPGQTGDTLTVSAVTQPTNGSVTIGAQGANLSYTPNLYFSGTDTFTYTVQESNGSTKVGTVTVTVAALPAPTAAADSMLLVENSAVTTINVLQNDTAKTSGHTLTVTALGTSANGGTVAIGTSGANVSYTPKTGFYGTDTFTYTVREQGAGWATATVTVLVTPTATDATFDVAKGSMTTLDVLKLATLNYAAANPYQQLTITAVTASSAGNTVVVSADGKHANFTPATAYLGTDTFTYTVSDGNSHTAQGTVTVNVKDYLPRAISGNVDSSSIAMAGFMRVRGMDLLLSGTDLSGNAVSSTVQTDSAGNYSFPLLAPGNYTVSKVAEPFLLTDSTKLTVATTGLSDGDSTGHNFAPAGRKAAFISIIDFLVTAPNQSAISPTDAFVTATGYVAAGADDTAEAGAQKWVAIESGWVGFTNVYVHLSQNPETVHVHAVKSDGTTLHHDLLATDTQHVQWLGKEGDAYLLRIIGSAAELGLDNSECCVPAASTTAAGEASSTTAQTSAAVNTPSATGEGEGVALTPAVTPSSRLLSAATQTATPAAVLAASEPVLASLTSNVTASTASAAQTQLAATASASEPVFATSSAPVDSYVLASTSSTVQTPVAAVTTATSTTAQAVDAVMAAEDFASTPDAAPTLKADSSDSSDYADAVDQVLSQTALETAV